MGIWGLVGGGVYRGDYEAGKNGGVVLSRLFVAVAESGNGGRHRYLPDIQYLTSKSLHATAPHTYNALSSTHYA